MRFGQLSARPRGRGARVNGTARGAGACVMAGIALALGAAPASAQLLIDQDRPDRVPPERATPQPDAAQAPEARSVEVNQQGTGAPLRAVTVEGSSASADQFESVWAPFAGRALDRETITEIANAVSAAYEDSGAALYTVVVPAQDLSSGELTLIVIEGYIEQVSLHGDVEGRDLSLIRAYGERLTAERPLMRATMERYLSLIRDIPGINVDVQLLTGQTRGGARLAVTIEQKRAEFTSSLNTSGSALLGRTQVTGNVDLYGLLRQGDHTRLSLTLPTNLENFFFVSGSHRIALGGDGLTAQLRASYLETQPESVPLNGEAFTAGLDVSYPLIRSYTDNVYLFGGADMLDSTNAVLGRLFSSEHTRNVRVGVSWSRAGETTFSSASATLSAGIDGLGADVDPLTGEEGFTKISFSLGHNRALGERFVARVAAGGQISGTDLPSSEAYALGGQQFGRAFSAADFLGDDALAGSVELAWRPSWAPQAFAGSELYVFADHARAWIRARPLTQPFHGDLSSAGAGTRVLIRGKHTVGLEFARALEAPPGLDDDHWRVVLSWNIKG